MGKYRAPFLNNDVIHIVENNKEPEQKLWIAVLAKAFDDAFYSADERAALEALSWIKHGSDFNYVCRLAGRDPDYVRQRMLNKVIEREAFILSERDRISRGVHNIVRLEVAKAKKTFVKKDYKYIPKYTHDYVDR